MGTTSPTIQAVYSACLGVIPHALMVIVGTVKRITIIHRLFDILRGWQDAHRCASGSTARSSASK